MKSKTIQFLAASGPPIKTIPIQLRPRRQSIARNATIAFLSTIAFTQAAIIEFALSPAGTDDAVGLRPANEVPVVVNSTGSGNAVSGGITFDTVTSTLSFTMGYGSAAGFTDLTGPATSMHIHGPAAAGTTASPLFDLAPVHFPAANSAKGGMIFGSVVFSAPQAANLLGGLTYVNIHTATNTGGEIRGQLIQMNAAPDIICPGDVVIECGAPATFLATISDVDGDAAQAVWSLNGVTVETDVIAASSPPSSSIIDYRASLPLGINTLALTVTDSSGSVSTCSSTITVVDTIAPVFVSVSVNPKVLWSPNHKMVPVTVDAEIIDACGSTTWEIVSVSSNQPVLGGGSGNKSPDWQITGDHRVSLRAERSGKIKSDRVYTIKVRATDESGNQSGISTVEVTVPHDQGKKK